MHHLWTSMKAATNRRSFLKNTVTAAGVATVGTGLLTNASSVLADEGFEERRDRLTRGDAAMLRFAAAAEILETDFWVQYNELAGIQDKEFPGGGGTGNPAYTAALNVLDSDMAQYVHDNTDDEFTHQNFLNGYLVSKGAAPVNLEEFRTLPGSTATGSTGALRLTNLMQLTLDTSWWTRYRDDSHNPDLDPNFHFPQAIATLAKGQHTAIPRTDSDTSDPNFLQAIAEHGRFPFSNHRTRGKQPVSVDGPACHKRRGSTYPDQHRPYRDHALSNLVGQSGQRAPSDGSRPGKRGIGNFS